jgi:hypothetical protein
MSVRSKLRLSIAAVLSLVAMALPSTAGAHEHRYPASLVAEVMVLEHPHVCHQVLYGVRVLGYEAAEEAFALTYRAHHPSAAQLFHALIKLCRG